MADQTKDREPGERRPAPVKDEVRQLVRMAGPRPTMPSGRVERMQADLRPLWEAEVGSHAGRRVPWRLVAAAAVLALVTVTVLLTRAVVDEAAAPFASVARLDGSVSTWRGLSSQGAERLTSGSELETGASVATAVDARAALRTVTGHSLRLDHDTRIVLVSERELRLEQGAVYVDAGAGRAPGDGLIVLTALGRVEEIGTQFEVRLSADRLRVRVREGEISLGAEGEVHRGVAGEQLTLSAGAVRRSLIGAHDAVFDWTQSIAPAPAIDGGRLGAFLAWAAREGGYAIEYSDEAIAGEAANVVLSGEVEGLTPREALEVVLPAVGLSHRIDGDTLSIARLDGGVDR